jgi:ADP-ribosylglycohydrolase
MDKESLKRRIYGCLAGVAVGDAMGMPAEFLTREQVQQHFGWLDRFEAPPAWHPLHWLTPGRVTDDTQQTLAIIRMILAKRRFTAQDAGQAVLDWRNGLPEYEAQNFLGPSTRRALEIIGRTGSVDESGLAGNTNGAVMRVSPAGLLHPGRPEDTLEDVVTLCQPTHQTDVALSGAAAIAFAVAACLTDRPTVEDVLEAALQGARAGLARAREIIQIDYNHSVPWEVIAAQVNPSVERRIHWAAEIARQPKPANEIWQELVESIGTGVLVIETVPLVLGFFLLSGGDPVKAILYGANAGGDTDSMASIAGAVAGAFAGIDAFPSEYLETIERINGLGLERIAGDLTQLVWNAKE